MTDEFFMEIAYIEAIKAKKKNEVPVGAVIVKDEKIVAKAHNLKNTKKNSLWHAEMVAINKATKKNKDFRLENCTMYVTLEPCPMCAGAIISSRIPKVVFASFDKEFGAGGSVVNVLDEPKFNHRCEVVNGVLKEKCDVLLSNFFKEIRLRKKHK